MFGPSADFNFNVVFFKKIFEAFNDSLDLRFAVWAALRKLLSDLFILGWVNIPKGEVFQFPLDLLDAETICKRRKNLKGLLGDAFSLCFGHVTESPHIVQAVG